VAIASTVIELFEFTEWRYKWVTADANAKPVVLTGSTNLGVALH